MKTIEEHLSLNYRTSVYRDDDGDYIVEVDELPGCMADGSTPDEAFKNLRHAMASWIGSRLAAGLDVPEPRGVEDYSGKILVRMPRSLHRRLSEQSRVEGVSLNQYIVSLLSESSVRSWGGASNVAARDIVFYPQNAAYAPVYFADAPGIFWSAGIDVFELMGGRRTAIANAARQVCGLPARFTQEEPQQV